jgi:hypothetical protein
MIWDSTWNKPDADEDDVPIPWEEVRDGDSATADHFDDEVFRCRHLARRILAALAPQEQPQEGEREVPQEWDAASRLHLMLLYSNADKLTRAERQTIIEARDLLAALHSKEVPSGEPDADSIALAAHYCGDSSHWTGVLRESVSEPVATRILAEAGERLRRLREVPALVDRGRVLRDRLVSTTQWGINNVGYCPACMARFGWTQERGHYVDHDAGCWFASELRALTGEVAAPLLDRERELSNTLRALVNAITAQQDGDGSEDMVDACVRAARRTLADEAAPLDPTEQYHDDLDAEIERRAAPLDTLERDTLDGGEA